jgi:hypothetical protein
MFNNTKKGAYSNLSMEKKMLLKIQNENLLPKDGGSDQPSLEHRISFTTSSGRKKPMCPSTYLST